jgi:protein-tyrosine-phosphatase
VKPKRVLILCTGNSARSQMTEGLLRAQCGHELEVFSAGTAPNRAVKEINLFRVFQMKRPQRMIPAPTRHTTAPITSHLSGRFPSMSHNHISDAAI